MIQFFKIFLKYSSSKNQAEVNMFQFIKRHSSLNKMVMLGIVLGITFGIVLPEIALEQKVIGTIFVNFLKMLVVPLVFASIFAAVSGLGTLEQLKNIGLKTIILYLLTTALSVLLAIILMNIFNIGEVVSTEGLHYDQAGNIEEFSGSKMLLSFIPTTFSRH